MLKLKSNCEKCNTSLPPNSLAYICSFECTFCAECTEDELKGVCPNCGGNLEKRPIRPENLLEKYPPLN